MSKQTIIQLRELDDKSTTYGPGDFDCILAEPVVLNDGDVLNLSSAFIDTREVSTTYIDIDIDTEIQMSFYLYNINHSGGFKSWGNDGNATQGPGGPRDTMSIGMTQEVVWRSSQARQDGQAYFLCTMAATLPEVSLITGLEFFQSSAGVPWGGTHVTYQYYDPTPTTEPTPGSTPPFDSFFLLPISAHSKRHNITIFIPPQEAGTKSVIVEISFVMLTRFGNAYDGPQQPIPFPEVFTQIDAGNFLSAINTEPLLRSGIIGIDSVMEAQNGFPDFVGQPKPIQTVMIPVQQNLAITIPKGKYLPDQLTKIINDSVINFSPNAKIGIVPADSLDALPTLQQYQRLPFETETNTSSIIGGLPTFTQSNYIAQPPTIEYDHTASVQNQRRIHPSKVGDSFFCNATPLRETNIDGVELNNSQGLLNGSCNLYSSSKFYQGYNDTWAGGNYTGVDMAAFIGSSQFALEYDSGSNLFKFNYLHTPLYAGIETTTTPAEICNYFINSAQTIDRSFDVDPSEGYASNPVFSSVQTTPSPGSVPANEEDFFNGGIPLISADPNYKRRYVGSNGGIVFSSLTPSTFWKDKLGFNLEPAVQDPSDGKITKKGIICGYQLVDIGYCKVAVEGNFVDNNPTLIVPPARYGFNTYNYPDNQLERKYSGYSPGQTYAKYGAISPQMPMIPYEVGMNATSGSITLESAIEKNNPYNNNGNAWFLVKVNDDDYASGSEDNQLPGGGWILPDINVIGDNTISIDAGETRLLNLTDSGYYLIEIDTKINNTFISSNETKSTLAAVVNKYYSINSYTSSDGSNIEYIHRGNPQLINSIRVRVLNPDLSPADLGIDTSVFLTLTQQLDPIEPQPVKKVKKT